MSEMKQTLVLAGVIALFGCSCGSDSKPDAGVGYDPSDIGSELDIGPGADAVSGSPDTGASAEPPYLTSTHGGGAGWLQASCSDCHQNGDAGYPHVAETYRDPDCAACHGANGARQMNGHKIGSNCKSCHRDTPHTDAFQVPDCAKCHTATNP